MIAIPNMDKPKNCKVCPFTCEKLAFFDGKNIPQGCPLIEIDDELFKKAESAYVLQQIRYGERRNDE